MLTQVTRYSFLIISDMSSFRSTRQSSARLSSGATTTETTLLRLRMTNPTLARRPPTSRSGTRSSCRSIRKCSSRLSSFVNPLFFQSRQHANIKPQASNYLDIKPLLDVGCKTVANMIKGKSPEEIRKTFNITNDFTPEEEEQIRRENEWAEDR